jgi:hypothetical protein
MCNGQRFLPVPLQQQAYRLDSTLLRRGLAYRSFQRRRLGVILPQFTGFYQGYICSLLRSRLSLSADILLLVWEHRWILRLTAVMGIAVAAAASTALAPDGGNANAALSVAGENIIASELDELFRSDRLPTDLIYRRSEAARILLKASSHNGVPNVDRDYLTVITAKSTGLRLEDAQARVDHEIAASAQELRRARTATVLQAFFIGAALFLGAAVAWFTACEGGRDREEGKLPVWDWSWHRRR